MQSYPAIMQIIFRIFLIILSVFTGVFFLYSAYTKLFPIQSFEYTIVEFGHMPWSVAAIMARVLIGLEAGLGALMTLHLFGKGKWILKAAFALVVFFSIYLIYLWATVGNNVNCGCFGDSIWMSPATSLLKNAGLLLIIGLLIRFHKGFSQKWATITAPIIIAIGIVATFIFFGLPDDKPNWLKQDSYTIDLSPLYAPGKKDIPAMDLRKGKHIVAFFSATCPHCRLAAYKMHIMKEQDTTLPFFMVIGGKSDLTDFWKHTNAHNIPYTRLDSDPFINIAGYQWPAIFMINDGRVDAKITYITLTENTIKEWLKK